MQARANAIDELTAAGTLEDFTAGGQTQLDRELAQLASQSQVDSDLARLKAEVGPGEQPKELAGGETAPAEGAAEPQEQGQEQEQKQ